MGMLRAAAAFSERFRNDEEKGFRRARAVRLSLADVFRDGKLKRSRELIDNGAHASKGYSQPPLKPARRNPVSTGKQRRMMSQSKPVR